jgi:hypothetical protein
MQVGEAKRIARDWVLANGRHLPGVVGAYFAGSVNWLPDHADLPATSDLDVNLVHEGDGPPPDRHKLAHHDVLIEVSQIPLARLRTPEQVLGSFALAGGFRVPSVILDPTGHLTALQAVVSREHDAPVWVRRRCESASEHALRYLSGLRDTDPPEHQAILWLFGTSLPTLLPLISARRNPTVRRRYVAAREILAEHGQLDLYEQMLGLLGCASMRRAEIEQHLAALERLFDAAAAALRSPFPFATDISPLARRTAIDGSRALIADGLYREAVFWIALTSARCLSVLATDAPTEQAQFAPGHHALLADLGARTFEDRQQRADQVRAFLPHLGPVVERIMAARP